MLTWQPPGRAPVPPEDLLAAVRRVVSEAVGAEPGQLAAHSFGGLGGSSLDAAAAAVRLRTEWGLLVDPQQLLRARDLDPLLRRLAEERESTPAEPPPAPTLVDGSLVPLTWQQRVIWYQSMLDPASTRYHFYALLHCRTAPDLARLRQVLVGQLARHPALRVRLAFQDGQPWQRVRSTPVTAGELDLVEVRLPASAGSPEELVSAVGADARFDLAAGPLVRWRLAVFPDGHATLVHAEHHLVHDGRSFQAFLQTIAEPADPVPDQRYFQYAHRRPAVDPAVLEQLVSRCRAADRGLFATPPEPPGSRDHFLRLPVPEQLLGAVRAAARQGSTTLFSGLFAAFGQALAEHQQCDTLVLGSAVDNRPAGHEDTVGMFVSTVPVVIDRQRDEPHQAVVQRTDQALAEAIQRADLPLSDLVGALGGPERRGGDGLVRAAFSMHQQPSLAVDLAGHPARLELGVFNGAAKFPVNVIALASGTGPDTRVQLLLEGAADAVTADDLWALWTLTIRWLRAWTGQPAPVAAEATPLIGRVVDHARSGTGGAIALDDGRESLTYRELVALGEAARDRLGWAGRRVGILGAASTGFFGCAYAAVHAGGTYLPLPVEKPTATLVETARRAGCEVVVDVTGQPDQPVLDQLRVALPGLATLDWPAVRGTGRDDGQPETGGEPAGPAAAYVIFTSGSTGVPKGVMVGRSSLARLAAWAAGEMELRGGTVVGQTASVSFDASVFELWSALYAGARLAIAPADLRADPYRLARWLDERGVECAFIGTPIAELICALDEQPARMRVVATGGDRLHPVPAGLPYRVLNMYGPTEHTVVATAGWVRSGGEQPPSIGTPLPYAYVRLVAADGTQVALGARAELWVGGAGLALGYLDDPRLTAARFVADPHSAWGEPAYRTGDLVRQQPDGALEFVGRDDRQVQVGGVRTELGEIEAAALRQPGVRQAAAVSGEDRGRRWVRLYLVPEPPAPAAELAEAVRAALPPHLRHLPVQPVAALPLTPNGKVDHAALAGGPAGTTAAAGTAVAGGTGTPVAGAADTLAPLLAQLPEPDALAVAYRLLGSVLPGNEHGD